MAGNIRLEVVTPEKSVVSEEAQIVIAPGSLGEFGVLIGHTPFLTTLKLGIIRYKDIQGTSALFLSAADLLKRFPTRLRSWLRLLKEGAILISSVPNQLTSAQKAVWKASQKRTSILSGPKRLWTGRCTA